MSEPHYKTVLTALLNPHLGLTVNIVHKWLPDVIKYSTLSCRLHAILPCAVDVSNPLGSSSAAIMLLSFPALKDCLCSMADY